MTRNRSNCLFVIVLIPIIFALAAAAALFFRAESDAAHAESEKKNYDFDIGALICRRNAAGEAAVYFSGAFDKSVSFTFVCGEEERNKLEPYIDGLEGDAHFYVVREEDDEFNAYKSAPVELTINTEMDLIRLPYGQETVYTGEAMTIDGAEFFRGNELSDAVEAGDYTVKLNYETAFEAPFTVLRANITVMPARFERRYLAEGEPTELVIDGAVSEEDRAFITENTSIIHSVAADSPVGTYTLLAEYSGEDTNNFLVTEGKGEYVVAPALLDGFTFTGLDILYDGKPHRLTVSYDEERWDGIGIKYNYGAVTDAGKYRCTADISKENYETLVLTAVLLIRAPYLESENLSNYVFLSGTAAGYDPEIKVSLVKSAVSGLDKLVEPLLVADDTYREAVLSGYDVSLTLDGAAVVPTDGEYSLKIKLYGLDTAAGVRILQYAGGEIDETDYTFENGYFVLKASSLEGFVFVKGFQVTDNSLSTLIFAALIGAAVLLVLCAVLAAVFSGGKAKRRWRKKHSKWA